MSSNNAKKPSMVATTVLVAAISVLVLGTATDAFATTPPRLNVTPLKSLIAYPAGEPHND